MGTTSLAKKAFHTIREDGIGGCVKKTNGYIKKQIKKRRRVEKIYKMYCSLVAVMKIFRIRGDTG